MVTQYHRNKIPRMAAYFGWLKKEGHMSMTDNVDLCTYIHNTHVHKFTQSVYFGHRYRNKFTFALTRFALCLKCIHLCD